MEDMQWEHARVVMVGAVGRSFKRHQIIEIGGRVTPVLKGSEGGLVLDELRERQTVAFRRRVTSRIV
ncbi:MAG: hypothetical protein QM572_08495 [Nocardioides sp.]|uniref:hypothetical protein n=1 Tax=Nocardioides sp. TaxID=35761 RepID=UPI0039E2B3DE